jgi:hypothetical protein
MEQITIRIPKYLDSWLRQEADRRETSVDELITEAVYLYRSRPPRRLLAAGAGVSGETDISQRMEKLLAAEWGRAKN